MIHNRVCNLHSTSTHFSAPPAPSFFFSSLSSVRTLCGPRFVVLIVDGCWEELYRRC
ncbi:hypothetical protein P692DRAFT_20726870 [Suillus brevipes Sb2]|nr:hypothetical protein P692DRAFT_20726870 [Suillus brevipes Sb2]